MIPDSCRSNFRPFYLHPPHAFLSLRSLFSPQVRSRSCRFPFPGRLPFWASPSPSRLANASGRIEFIIFLIMDWSFASGCSPPRLSATQFPSATDSQCSVRWGLPPHCWCALSGALGEASPLCTSSKARKPRRFAYILSEPRKLSRFAPASSLRQNTRGTRMLLFQSANAALNGHRFCGRNSRADDRHHPYRIPIRVANIRYHLIEVRRC